MNARKLTTSGIVVLAALTGVLLFSRAQADANLANFAFASSFGSFESEGIAVDESTGDVYVYSSNGGTINKFDAEGNPVDFSSLGSNQITGVGSFGFGETEMAVDNSTGPAAGDIYLAGSFSGVQIFGSDGKALGRLTEAAGVPWGEVACGVAVDRAGHVYLGVYPSYVNEYIPTSNPVADSDYSGSITGVSEVCNVAADPEGSVYVDTWAPQRNGPIVKYAAQSSGNKQILADGGGSLAVANSEGAELFVGHHKEIQQYDSSGNLLSSFGSVGSDSYVSVAVDAKNGKLYASNNVTKTIEIWQGAVVPGVSTGKATNLAAAGDAILTGSVNPEETSVENCSFQYGMSVSYGSTVPCEQAMPLTGSGTLAVSAAVTGATPNHVYHYRLSASNAQGTFNGVDQTFTILVPPTVEDQPPTVSSIARASATLTGTIDPEQAETSYHFEYGTSESYGNNTNVGHTGSGEGDSTVSQQLRELLPDTVYHYRLVAENIAGVATGSDHTFTTGAPTPPLAITLGFSGVGQNSANVTGTVDTDGLPTTYGFEIGTSTDYGPPTGLGSVGAGLSATSVSLSLTGLSPGTTYHYRLTAANIDGTSYGADQTFTTGVFASTFAEPPAPLAFVAVPQIAFPSEARQPVKKTGKTEPKAKKHKKAKHKKAKGKKAKGKKAKSRKK